MQRTASQLPLFAEGGANDGSKPGGKPGFVVRESARAKRISIRVYPRGKVEVVVPRRTRPGDVEAFVHENRDWIAAAVTSFEAELSPESYHLPVRIDLPAVERRYAVAYRRRVGQSKVRFREHGDTLVLSGATDDETACREALKRWLGNVARREFGPRLDALSAALRLPYRRLQIRAQRSCWGSHSARGTISLNLCLLFVAPDVLRYLLVHELAHGRHMDHSRSFWKLVQRCEPRYRRLDKALGDAWRVVPGWVGVY